MVLSNPTWETAHGDGNIDWNIDAQTVGSDWIPSNHPMSVEFYGIHFSKGYEAPIIYARPDTRIVFSNCYLNSLLYGAVQCDSSQLIMLNCQVVENGDASRTYDNNWTPPPGIVYLRGHSAAQIWQCSFVDNVKDSHFIEATDTKPAYTVDPGTIVLRDSATLHLRNSILWETTNNFLGVDDYQNAHPAYASATSDYRKVQIRVAPTAIADVQSSLIYQPDSPSTPYPSSGAPNIATSNSPLLDFFNSATSTDYERSYDLRTRRLGYTAAGVPTVAADGVTSITLDTSTGSFGPLGYRRHLKYDLEGHARKAVYRKTAGAATPTKVDLGSVEIVPTIRDSNGVQPAWTDLTTVSSTSAGAIRLAASLRAPNEVRQAGQMMTLDANTGRSSTVASADLSLDGLSGDTTVQAVCFDTTNNRLFGLGDQRRGGLALPKAEPGFTPPTSLWPDDLSKGRGCYETGIETLAACVQQDHGIAVLRGSYTTILPSTIYPSAPFVRNNLIPNYTSFLNSGNPTQSPYRQQETTGLRAAIRAQLAALPSTGTSINSIKAANAYPDGVIIAFNTKPRFGKPKDGQAYGVGAELPYDGGVVPTAGTIIVAQAGSSASEQKVELSAPAYDPTVPGQQYYYRAWPYAGNGSSRVYGPALDASISNYLNSGGALIDYSDSKPSTAAKFPLVINEVMSGLQGWVEVFNTSGEAIPAGSAVTAGAKLVARTYSTVDTTDYTAVADLSNVAFPARGIVVFAIPPGKQATATATRNAATGAITAVNLTAGGGGSLYVIAPPVTITGGGGSGAVFTANLTSGSVTSFTQVNGGTGYTSVPTVIVGPSPSVPGEYPFVKNPSVSSDSYFNIGSTSRVLIVTELGASDSAKYDRLKGKPRALGVVSMGRLWDGGPRGASGISSSAPDDSALFDGTSSTNPEHPVTRGTSNTANYTDSTVGTVAQPYFQVSEKSDLTKIWFCWRNLGNVGCAWESDGLRHDFVGARVEGAAFNGGNVLTGLRMPLTGRKAGNALVMSVPATGITTGTGTAWGTLTATKSELNLNNQGIRAIQWCPQVDVTGKYLIIAGPPTDDDSVSHPSIARFALWSWAGGAAAPVLRIADLAPYAKYPTGVCSFLLPGSTEARIAFAQAISSNADSTELENIIHWPLTVLSP